MTHTRTYTDAADPRRGDVQAAVDAGIAAHTPHLLEPGKRYAIPVPAGGQVHEIDLDLDIYRERPRRKTGTTIVRDAESFVDYCAKHSDEGTEYYASRDNGTITAVLNANEQDGPRWGDHRAVLQLKHSKPWHDWTSLDGKGFAQADFAEWIEDHLPDVRDPAAADLMEIAQTFEATTTVNFQAGSRIVDGQRRLTYVETIDATAAQGTLTIPASITLGLLVYEGGDQADPITARLRYRIGGGKLTLSYHLDRPEDAVKAAFDAVVESIAREVARPIWAGTPNGR